MSGKRVPETPGRSRVPAGVLTTGHKLNTLGRGSALGMAGPACWRGPSGGPAAAGSVREPLAVSVGRPPLRPRGNAETPSPISPGLPLGCDPGVSSSDGRGRRGSESRVPDSGVCQDPARAACALGTGILCAAGQAPRGSPASVLEQVFPGATPAAPRSSHPTAPWMSPRCPHATRAERSPASHTQRGPRFARASSRRGRVAIPGRTHSPEVPQRLSISFKSLPAAVQMEDF